VAPRILLLQARSPGDPVREEERRSFAGKTGLPLENIVPWDLLTGPPEISDVLAYDALMVGGSADYYVSNRSLPRFMDQLALLGEVVDRGHPTFASCFGFQLLTEALGGKVIHDPASTEVGTYDLVLTEEGRADPLLGRLPPIFAAQMGRKDRVEILPSDALHLAASERNPHQAFRVRDKPVWSTQFHPELDSEANFGRFMRYQETYSGHFTAYEREEAHRRFRPSPETEVLLPGFLELVFEWRGR
jgi:GMP synthase (glutamine-hydrolysing)